MRSAHKAVTERIGELEKRVEKVGDEQQRAGLATQLEQLKRRSERMQAAIEQRERQQTTQ